jgi:hypothetical protein
MLMLPTSKTSDVPKLELTPSHKAEPVAGAAPIVDLEAILCHRMKEATVSSRERRVSFRESKTASETKTSSIFLGSLGGSK